MQILMQNNSSEVAEPSAEPGRAGMQPPRWTVSSCMSRCHWDTALPPSPDAWAQVGGAFTHIQRRKGRGCFSHPLAWAQCSFSERQQPMVYHGSYHLISQGHREDQMIYSKAELVSCSKCHFSVKITSFYKADWSKRCHTGSCLAVGLFLVLRSYCHFIC